MSYVRPRYPAWPTLPPEGEKPGPVVMPAQRSAVPDWADSTLDAPPPPGAAAPAEAPQPGGAWRHQLRWWWHRRIGWAGVAALLLLAATAALAFAVRPLLHEREREALRAHVARLDATMKLRDSTAAATNQRDPRDQLRDALPPSAERGAVMARLLGLLGETRLGVLRGEYKTEDEAPGLMRLRVTLPVRGEYAAMREFVAQLLNTFPNAALDGLDIERSAKDAEGLNGHLRLSLFFRRELS